MSTATISVSRAILRLSLRRSVPAAILSVAVLSRARCSLDVLTVPAHFLVIQSYSSYAADKYLARMTRFIAHPSGIARMAHHLSSP